jgi:hypothetical protein
MKGSGLRRMTAIIAICALVGALAGIAGSAAAPSKSSKAAQAQKKAAKAKAKAIAKAQKRALKGALLRGHRGGPGLRFFGPGGPGGGPVHSETVIPNADGTDFITITTDAGVLLKVDGNTLHIKQATDKATYKADNAIDVGSSPTVVRNHEKATLSDLKDGDHVRIIKGGPKGTFVIAEDDAFIAQEKKEHHGFGFGPGGPGGPRGHRGGPPPGAPGYPGDDDQGSNKNGSSESGSSSSGTNS